MPPRVTLTLAFEIDGGPVDLTQLGDFLLLFRGAYVASIRSLSRLDVDAVTRNPGHALTLVRRRLRRLRVRQLDQLFTSELGEDALTATTISRDNPLKITVSELAAAVILSGGRFGGFRASAAGRRNREPSRSAQPNPPYATCVRSPDNLGPPGRCRTSRTVDVRPAHTAPRRLPEVSDRSPISYRPKDRPSRTHRI